MFKWMMRVGTLVAALHAGVAFAVPVPFAETFDGSNANWEDIDNDPLTWVATGGADGGGYVSTTYNYFGFTSPFGGGPVLFRATGSDGASGGAFIGDWLSDGVGMVSFMMRHDASEALTPFLRVAGAANFPGAVMGQSQPVQPNVWTQIDIPINVFSQSCTGEGVSCAAAFSNVFNLQFGTNAPAGLVAQDATWTIDVDRVELSSVPEPGTAALLGFGLVGLGWQARRRG